MRRALVTIAIAIALAVATASAAFATQPPGLRGYEGYPGHQAGPQHMP